MAGMELFAEAINNKKRVVDAKSKTHTCGEVKGEDADACKETDDVENEECSKDRAHSNNERHGRGDKPTKNKEQQYKCQRDGDGLSQSKVFADLVVDGKVNS